MMEEWRVLIDYGISSNQDTHTTPIVLSTEESPGSQIQVHPTEGLIFVTSFQPGPILCSCSKFLGESNETTTKSTKGIDAPADVREVPFPARVRVHDTMPQGHARSDP